MGINPDAAKVSDFPANWPSFEAINHLIAKPRNKMKTQLLQLVGNHLGPDCGILILTFTAGIACSIRAENSCQFELKFLSRHEIIFPTKKTPSEYICPLESLRV